MIANKTALTVLGTAAAPLVLSQISVGSPYGTPNLKNLAFLASILGGGYWYLSKDKTAGAVALGSGLSWAIMKLGGG